MLMKYLIPVGRIWLFLCLLLNPLQICCNESLKTHTVIRLRREGPTVAHESVHPVLVDELKQTYSETLGSIICEASEENILTHKLGD